MSESKIKVPADGQKITMGADGRLQGMLDMHEPRETQLQKLRLLAGS